jgi:hypothetical protein
MKIKRGWKHFQPRFYWERQGRKGNYDRLKSGGKRAAAQTLRAVWRRQAVAGSGLQCGDFSTALKKRTIPLSHGKHM